MQVDEALLARWEICHQPTPNFGRLRQAIGRQGAPDRLPLFEVNIDNEVLAAVLNEPVQNPAYVNRLARKAGDLNRADSQRYVRQLIKAYYHLGYDYVILPVYLPMGSPMLVGQDTAALRRAEGRSWVDETRGPITSWAEFDRLGWCQIDDVDFYTLEYAVEILPEGMGLIVRTRGVMEWLMRLMGFTTLCYALNDQPELVAVVTERVGCLVVGLVRHLVELPGMSAISIYDDMGFRTNTFISPEQLSQYVLPWTKQCVEVTHAHGLPFILHACGNLEKIMDALIDDIGIDAKHSFEDVIMPMAEVKARYGQRIGILGGVDMHTLAAGNPDSVRVATRQAIQACAPGGGFGFGSGNTIANYIPLENYLAMLDEAKRVGWHAA